MTADAGLKVLADLSGFTILVLEDDDDSRELFRSVLANSGATVVEASNVQSAREIVGNRKLNLIVTDLAMPHEDGASFLAWLRKQPPDKGGMTAVIAVTAFQERYSPTNLRGYSAYFQKPVRLDDFLGTVASLLGRRGSARPAR